MQELGFIRTALFVPGNRPDRVDKAIHAAADVVIIDLEDAIPYAFKAEARPLVRAKIIQHKSHHIFVRVNGLDTEFIHEDLNELVHENLGCIIVPKIDNSNQIQQINQLLTEAERKIGMAVGSISIIALIESALGVRNVFSIVAEKTNPSRLFTVAFGAADFALDMGIELTKNGDEIAYPRVRLALACRAAGIAPPLDTPFMIDLKDPIALEADAKRAKQFGFQGKLCIHPNQVDICNRIFSPTPQEIAYAHKIIQAYAQAESRGTGAILVDSKFVDYPVVERSQRILQMARKISSFLHEQGNRDG